jgi:MFS family permease
MVRRVLSLAQRSKEVLSLFITCYYLGTLLGALGYDFASDCVIELTPHPVFNSGGVLSDRIGRIKTVMIAGLWGIFGTTLQVAAQNANWVLCARILAGVGTGGISAVIPVWSSELISHDHRGALIAFEMVINDLGISASCKSPTV